MTTTIDEGRTLIDALIAEQRSLSAVDRFSSLHDSQPLARHGSRYRDLMPVTPPGPGQQYAFEVDLDRCSGCKGCVTACHSMNGLDDDETWREVGLLVEEAPPEASPEVVTLQGCFSIQQTVTTACHHCIDPGCLNGCPVLAYDKDPRTGIVRHLDDQCIGCNYCTLTCPYEVPRYSKERGIVRKCDMCQGRLAAGEAPACVQGCPNEAIRIVLTDTEQATQSLLALTDPNDWLPDAPDPKLTLPTTRYLSTREQAGLRAADHGVPNPQPPHWPLIWMLVLTQAGIGGLTVFELVSSTRSFAGKAVGFGMFAAGMIASVFHLGRPHKAWRIWLGWKTSWLSREAILLSLFGALATVALIQAVPGTHFALPPFVPGLALATGIACLIAQSRVYSATQRVTWRMAITMPRFMGTSLLLGAGLALAVEGHPAFAWSVVILTAAKLLFEASLLRHAASDDVHHRSLRDSARLQRGPVLLARWLCAALGGFVVPAVHGTWGLGTSALAFGFLLLLAGEILERRFFFVACAPDKMPGHVGVAP